MVVFQWPKSCNRILQLLDFSELAITRNLTFSLILIKFISRINRTIYDIMASFCKGRYIIVKSPVLESFFSQDSSDTAYQ